jgi:methionyl-tRNA formyltransferase
VTAAPKRVVLLCNDCTSSRLVAQALHADGALDRIVLVTNEMLGTKLRRRARRHGRRVVASQVACAALARVLHRARGGARRERELLSEIGLATRWPDVPLVAVGDVNSPACVHALREAQPELVVVNGTDLIHDHVLQAVDAPFVNLHCGLTPAYRGVHGGFWALASGRPQDVGVTLHEIDTGVDTGRVLAQARADAQPGTEGFLTLPLLQYREGLPLLRAYVRAGAAPGPVDGGGESRQWYHPGLRDYLRALRRGTIRA